MKKTLTVILLSALVMSISAPSFAADNAQTADAVRAIVQHYYVQSADLARSSETGRVFTDHKLKHIEMVDIKSLEVVEAVRTAVLTGQIGKSSGEAVIPFSADIDEMTLEAAALSHDTGMNGGGYALEPVCDENGKQLKDDNGKKMFARNNDGSYTVKPESDSDFDEVRANHSLNSAINVLVNRELYRQAGFSDEQIDKIAAECMAHSKSSSGVLDLNSREDWSDSFDRIESTVKAYNLDHPEKQIFFSRASIVDNETMFGALVSETLALRIGDVSRDSEPDAEAQSGEIVHVDRSTLNNRAGSIAGELENADITIGDNGDQVLSEKSRQVHAGEQNIIENHTYIGVRGKLTHEITVADGSSAPLCTQEAISDHLSELGSAKDDEFDVVIIFISPCDDFAVNSYEQFRDDSAAEYINISICYPWDKEE